MGKQETANAVQESGYLSITGPDGFRRNPQNLWDWTECFLDPLEFQGKAKGKRGFEFYHSAERVCLLVKSSIGLEWGPIPQGVRIRIKKQSTSRLKEMLYVKLPFLKGLHQSLLLQRYTMFLEKQRYADKKVEHLPIKGNALC